MQNSRVFRNLILLADPPWTGDWDVNGANESFSRKEIRGVSVYSVTKQLLLRQQVALHRLLFCRKWEWIFSKQHLPAAKQLLRICWCVAGLGKSSGRGRCGLWLLSGGYPESSSGATELHLTTTTTLLVKKRKGKTKDGFIWFWMRFKQPSAPDGVFPEPDGFNLLSVWDNFAKQPEC